VVNDWTLGGVIPLQHHGFVLKTAGKGYLSLDFCRRGIDWEASEEPPELPDGTCLVKRFRVNADPSVLEDYCAETEPFSWFGNNCKTWSHGMMEALTLDDDACEEDCPPVTARAEKWALGLCGGCGAAGAGASLAAELRVAVPDRAVAP